MSVSFRWLLSAVVLAGCVGAIGCESDNEDPDRKDREELERIERREREQARERDLDPPDQVIGRDTDRLDREGSRARRGIDEIPTTANRVAEGDSPRLTFRPTRDGTLYVYDADDDRVVYSGAVRADDRFVMDPADDRATVNGRTVLGADLSPKHRYRLYFDRGRK